jgi:hypothetical protein
MALTVRPDDEVYQFDTVWLGPDEYTLPIQARYVAWGTWLACFLVAAVVLIPIGGDGPAGVLGSLIWALGLSVVLSRPVRLVLHHPRPLRSLPALFSAEARAAVQARRRAERALLVRPGKIRVRETPAKVVAIRERQRARVAARVAAPPVAPEEPAVEVVEADWVPEAAEPTPGWSIPTDVSYDPESDTYAPVPVTYGAAYPATPYLTVPEPDPYEPVGFVKPGHDGRHAAPGTAPAHPPQHAPAHAAAPVPGQDAPRSSPFRTDPHQPEDRPYRGPVTVAPQPDPHGRHARPARDEHPDGQAAIEARILLPARKDR